MGKYNHLLNDNTLQKDEIQIGIANELASLVKLKKIELKHSIRFNLTEETKKEINEA